MGRGVNLSKEVKAKIIRLQQEEQLSKSTLAKRFGISYQMVAYILKNEKLS